MTTRTARAWLAAALTAVVLLPMQALADWRDASGYLTVTQSARAFDRANRRLYSYVTITNTATNAQGQPVAGAITGPLRLVIPSSNFGVVGADGSTEAPESRPYLTIPEPVSLDAGESLTVRVNFALERGALSFTTRPERFSPTTQSITLPATAVEGSTVTGVMSVETTGATYLWTQTGGTTVAIIDPTAPKMSFTAPATTGIPQVLTFQGQVTDPATGVVTTASQSITIEPDRIAVDAGADRGVTSGQTVHLNAQGVGSGTDAIYTWAQVSPTDALVTLANAGTANPSFVSPTVDQPRTLVFEVTFTDGLKTATDQVAIDVTAPLSKPNAPLTLGGATQRQPLIVTVSSPDEIAAGSTRQLVATASGGDGTYTWSWKKPIASSGGAPCELDEGARNTATFEVTAPTAAACPSAVSYKIGVDVTDGTGDVALGETNLFLGFAGSPPLTVTATPKVVDEGPQPALLGVSVTGGTGPYSYVWTQTGPETTPGSGTLDPAFAVTLTDADTEAPSFKVPPVNGDTELTFHVAVTDAASGTGSTDATVMVRDGFATTSANPLTVQFDNSQIQVPAGTPRQVSATASGGQPGYTWSWVKTAGGGATLTGTDTPTVTVTPAAGSGPLTLAVTITDQANNTATAQVTVDVPAVPSGPLAIDPIAATEVDTGSTANPVSAHVTGGSPPYTYAWEFTPSGGLTTLALSDANQATMHFDAPSVTARTLLVFKVTVTDSAGASVTTSAYRTVKATSDPLGLRLSAPLLRAAVGQTVSLHAGEAYGGSGSYTYSWTQIGGSAASLTDANQPTATFVAPPTASGGIEYLAFKLTVRDANNPSATAQDVVQQVEVGVPPTPMDLSCPPAVFFSDAITLEVSGTDPALTLPLSYDWYLRPNFVPNPGNQPVAQGTVPTITTNIFNLPDYEAKVRVTDSSSPAKVRDFQCRIQRNFVTAAANKPASACLLCGDEKTKTPCNDLDLVIGTPTRCPARQPYCMNDVIQRGADIKEYRRCVALNTCDSLWYGASSDQPLCLPFDPNSQEDSLNCHLCCYGDNCNLDTNPPDATLYRP